MKNKYPDRNPYKNEFPHLVTTQATENKKGSLKIDKTKATEELELSWFEKHIFTKKKNQEILILATSTPHGILRSGGCLKVK